MAWKNYVCEISDRPALVLVDDRFLSQAPLLELPTVTWVGVYCNQPAGNSFWNPDETEQLDKLEDDLIKTCSLYGYGNAVYVLMIATHGIREYYFYNGNKADLDKAISEVKTNHPTYRIELDMQEDKSWNQYTKFVK